MESGLYGAHVGNHLRQHDAHQQTSSLWTHVSKGSQTGMGQTPYALVNIQTTKQPFK